MSVLIAVVNCQSRLAYQQCIRETWLPLVQGADVRFFLGPAEREPKADEVFVECDDSYQGLPSKVKAIARWASEHNYNHMLKLDDDTVVKPQQLLASNFQSSDFVGHRNDIRPYPVPYGFAYWLSRRAMKLVANAELPIGNNDEVWVTSTLSKEGIVLRHDPRYLMHTGNRYDFAPSTPRPLRAPPRPKLMEPVVENPFVWVMYIPWVGYRELPEELNIREMKRLFKEVTQ